MIEKADLEKVELANDLLVMLKSASPQDRIDILQLAQDSMLAKKRLNEPQKKHVRTWIIHSKTQLGAQFFKDLEEKDGEIQNILKIPDGFGGICGLFASGEIEGCVILFKSGNIFCIESDGEYVDAFMTNAEEKEIKRNE